MVYLTALSIVVAALTFSSPQPTQAALSESFGVIGAVPSLSSSGSKQAAIDKISEAGFGWMRHEFHYESPMSFEHYDAANSMAKAKGIKTLGLLAYPGSDKSHDDWKNYVQSVVSHYGSDISAWEIMNEADNYLSPADYVVYLKEAKSIIKGINPSATIVLTGITSRPETPTFWNGVSAAGGWGDFDVAGLHVYHSGNPEKVNFGGGDLVAEYDRAISSLSKNGGGKKIWITETGYKAGDNGNQGQADYLARTLILSRSVSQIERIFVYRLYDDGQADYGLLTSGLSERPSYGAVKSVINNLSGAGIGTRLYPQSKTTLDGMESVGSWTTKQSSNATTALSTAEGKSGQALKISYNFSADQAYSVVEKTIAAGQPEAFAAWFYGDDTRNVWKYRFKDAKGETFQADLGNLASGWSYKQFTIGQDTAYVSWDGDNKIDYPISFNSIVIDKQSGDTSGTGLVDELIAITGGADLFAYQFGSTVAYWKVSGTASADLCGAKREFSQTPAYATGVSCGDTPKTASVTTTAKATATASPKASTTPVVVDKDKSSVRLDGTAIVADGKSTYRIVVLLKDASGKVIKSVTPKFAYDNGSGLTTTGPTLVGDEWWYTIASTEVGERKITVTAGSVSFPVVTVSFVAAVVPSPSPSPEPSPSLSPVVEVQAAKQQRPWWFWALVVGLPLLLIAGSSAWYFLWFRKRRGKRGTLPSVKS